MRCERCHGTGKVIWDQLPQEDKKATGINIAGMFPCPDCGGCGTGHCCDGLRADPEMEDRDDG